MTIAVLSSTRNRKLTLDFMTYRLPILSNWQDFESLCHMLWKEIWCDPNAQKNGRAGQPQAGVDVFGRPVYSADYMGVQCKDKNRRLGSKLTQAQLIKECGNARKFSPCVASFTLATSAESDQLLQAVARNFNVNKAYPFDVHVWSWNEIEAEVACRPNLLDAFYRDFSMPSDNSSTVKIAVTAPRDQFMAFFSRPQISARIGNELKDNLAQVAYELSDNAFLHGKASQVKLSFEGDTLSIEDNGLEFNPLRDLNSAMANITSHIGSLVFELFGKSFANDVKIEYSRSEIDGQKWNILRILVINAGLGNFSVPEVLDLPVDFSAMFGRRGAERYAESLQIPLGIKELVIVANYSFNISGSMHLIDCIRGRLPPAVKLTVSIPRNHPIGKFIPMFNRRPGIEFQLR
jgi:hypothetical protein